MDAACRVPLSQVAVLNPRLLQALSDDTPVSFVPMAALSAEAAKVTSEAERRYAEVRKGYTYFESGDVLVAKITPCFENGKIAEAVLSHQVGFGSTEFHVVRPKLGTLDGRYLHHFLRQAHIRVEGERRMTGSGGQRRVPESFLAKLAIPLPPLSEQRRIAAILDQADALRAKRREALAQLDKLTQSIFIEMFGDPSTNPSAWPAASLGDFIFSASDGPHVSPSYSETGIPFLSTRHIRPGEISWTDLKYLAETDAEVQWKKCRPQRGDILYTKGGTTGLAAAVRTDTPFAIWVHVALLKPDPSKVETEWLESMLNAEFCHRQSQDLTHGIANRDLGLKRMTKIRMYSPPLSLQREFVERKERINSIRSTGRFALTELDALFASLQHRAFAGQL